jgi:anti-anti-sigma factor
MHTQRNFQRLTWIWPETARPLGREALNNVSRRATLGWPRKERPMLTTSGRKVGDVVIIDLSGRLDGSDPCKEIYDLIKTSLDQGETKFLLNFTQLEWINSLGVGFLAAAVVSIVRSQAALRVYGLTSRVSQVLMTCGVVPNILRNLEDEESALRSFS